MPRTPVLLALAASAALLLTLGACDSSNDDVEVVVPPLEVRSTYPDRYVTEFSGVQSLSVTFQRVAANGTVRSAIWPLPDSAGVFSSNTGTGRAWTWHDVALDPQRVGYFWLIDGYEMVEPYLVPFGTSTMYSSMGFAGFVESADTTQFKPDGTVLFALPLDSGFNPLDPSSFATARDSAVALSIAFDDNASTDDPVPHWFRFVDPSRPSYLVVGVLDTDNDLDYDITKDWWGYFKQGEDPGLARPFPFGDPQYMADVSVTIRPPAAP